MGTLAENDVVAFLKKRAGECNGFLLFGTDEAGIASLVRSMLHAWPDAEEPLRLAASSLRDDASLLDDAFRAMSLLGDRRLIVVDGCEEIHARFLLPIINEQAIGNFCVLVCGSLNKSSKLREAAVASRLFQAISIYEENAASFMIRIQKIFAGHGLAFGEGAEERFLALTGDNRAIAINEAEKVATYCWPAKTVLVEDVDACCGDQASFGADALISAVMDGSLEDCDRVFESMRADGEWRQVLIMLQMHLTKLESIRAMLDTGGDMDQAFRAARPPVFFTQQKTVAGQARLLSLDDLALAQQAVQTAILQSRQNADLGEAICSRALLSLCRMMRQLRRKQFA